MPAAARSLPSLRLLVLLWRPPLLAPGRCAAHVAGCRPSTVPAASTSVRRGVIAASLWHCSTAARLACHAGSDLQTAHWSTHVHMYTRQLWAKRCDHHRQLGHLPSEAQSTGEAHVPALAAQAGAAWLRLRACATAWSSPPSTPTCSASGDCGKQGKGLHTATTVDSAGIVLTCCCNADPSAALAELSQEQSHAHSVFAAQQTFTYQHRVQHQPCLRMPTLMTALAEPSACC